MNFSTKKGADAWCAAGNNLSIELEIACARHEKRLHSSVEPQNKELSRSIYKLQKKFAASLQKEMDRIQFEFSQGGKP